MAGGTERDRVNRNFEFIRDMGFDGARILYDVNWSSGLAVHGTPTALLEMLASARHDFGLRFKITVTGGSSRDNLQLAREVRDVARQIPDAIALLEGVNEANIIDADLVETAVAMGRILAETGLPTSVGLGNQGLDLLVSAGNAAGTNVDSVHIERSGDWIRWIRQAGDFRDLKRATDNGEPMGPGSSAVATDDPFILATLAVGSRICGAGMHVHHTGDGIFGYTYQGPTGWRYANLYDRPNAAAQFRAVRAASDTLYRAMEPWHHYNTNLPMEITTGRVDKQYGARHGKDFVHLLTHTEGGPVVLRENEPIEWWTLVNPETGEIVNTDANLRAYILVGRVR